MGIKKNIFASSTSGLGATRRAAVLLLVMMLTTATAWAQTSITPTTPSQDADGYYLIGSAAELYGFAALVNNGNTSANAKLTADIVVNENVLDANGDANTGDFVQWTPIGNNDMKMTYSGTFDGQRHTISGLYVSVYVSGSGWRVGLIGEADGTAVVKNVGIVDSYFSSSGNMLGSIVGGVPYGSSVTLANVYSTSTVKGGNWIGGLVGGDGFGSVTIINSYFAGKTSAGWSYGSHHDDLVAGDFDMPVSLIVVNTFVLGTSNHGTSATATQLTDGTVAAALHYYQDALADGSIWGISGGKTDFSGTLDDVSVTTANITLHTFDGDATTYSSKYIVGNTTPLPVNVVRDGYRFSGWYDNADLEGDAVTKISSSATGEKEYWAKFLPVYSVSFNTNGHGTAPDAQSVMQGYTATEPASPTADGYDFGGWYATSACTGEAYDFGTAVSCNVELFAKWMATTYYLNYDLAGGTVATENPTTYTIESADITLVNPTKDGYTFAGWTGTDLTEPTMTVTIASGSTGDRQYTATWTMTWANVKAALQAGQSVTLANDVTRVNSECIEPSGTVTLDLNGYTIDGGTTQTNPLFRIGDGVSLTITDSQTGGNLCNAGTNPTVAVNGGTLTLAAGTINAQSGGVIIWGGNFNMTGGTITGGISSGVYLYGNDGRFTMSGGSITGNETGVNVGSANATFTVSGNVNITGNTKNSITTDVSLNYDYQSSTLSPIHIGGALNEAARIGINIDDYAASAITGDVVKVITNGLEGKGTKQNFVLNGRDGHALVTNANGELTIGKIYSLSVPENVTVSGFTTVSTNTYNVGCGDVVTLLYGADNVSSGWSVRYTVHNGAITYLGAADAQGKCAEFTMPGSDMTITKDGVDNHFTFGGITLKETFSGGASQGLDATFDGSSEVTVSIPDPIEVKSVSYNRTFTTGKCATIMLPFSMDVSNISGTNFYTFGGVTKTADKWIATMNQVTGTLAANTPYLVEPTATTLTFTGGATLNTTGGGNCLASDTEGWEFHGTYTNKVWDEVVTHDYGFAATSGTSADNKSVEAGQFVRLTTGASAKPMRCYLSYVGVPNQARALTRGAAATDEELPQRITVRLVGSNGETTAIGTIDTKTGEMTFGSEAWYTLDGVRLSGKPTKKGLYINNGKKVVIK